MKHPADYGAYVYLLRCSDGSYYCGSCRKSVDERVAEHNDRIYPKSYTALRTPVVLVWCEYFSSIIDAIACERQIKGWSRAKKEALIDQDWARLQQLSKARGATRPVEHPQSSS
jgi:putative endonuclease